MQRNHVAISAVAAGAGAALLGWELARRRNPFDFRDRVVLITGGSRGLGFVMARQLAKEGARLALVARSADDLESAAARLRDAGADVFTWPSDIGDREQAHDAIERTVAWFGRIDVLINNAGVIQVGPVEHMTREDFEQAMAVHFWGPLNLTMTAVPHFARQGGGRIVNISSIGGKVAVPHLAPYSASKFALAGLSEALRAELAAHNIVITTVVPGLMRTGSPVRAGLKGRHGAEYSWFTVSDSLPVLTISADRAASKILDACRYGHAELIITPWAKLAVAMNGIAPGLLSRLMTIVNTLLPDAAGPEGNELRRGHESETAWTQSPLTALTRKAAVANNEKTT